LLPSDAGRVGSIDLVRLGQKQEDGLRRKDLSEPVAERRAQIPSLAGLFRDD
jgi:hypothetical protein